MVILWGVNAVVRGFKCKKDASELTTFELTMNYPLTFAFNRQDGDGTMLFLLTKSGRKQLSPFNVSGEQRLQEGSLEC